jgi:hypothetical protein
MFSHINDFDTLNSIEALNSKITGDIVIKNGEANTKRMTKQKKQTNMTFSNYNNQANIICAIQNYPKFLNFLIYIRRPCSPNVYMYVESESNVVFIVGSISGYPILVVKFPINQPYIYAKANEMCFDFPLKTISSFIDKIDKSTYQFELILKHDNDKKVLEYKSTNLNKTQITENLTSVNKSVMLNEIFFNKIQNNALFESDIGLNIDYEQELNSMPIYILAESRSYININKRMMETVQQKLIITDDSVGIFQKINVDQSYQKLIDRYSKTSYVYWNDNFESKELNMIKYNSIFKSYDKLINNNDYLYFLVCGWREYANTKTYLFVKVITNGTINKDNIMTFGDLFGDVDKIIEIYLCHTM